MTLKEFLLENTIGSGDMSISDEDYMKINGLTMDDIERSLENPKESRKLTQEELSKAKKRYKQYLLKKMKLKKKI